MLQLHLAPSDQARSTEVLDQYTKLNNGPTRNQNIESWPEEWVLAYQSAKDVSIAEVVDTKRCCQDFVSVIEKHDHWLTRDSEYAIESATDHEALLFNILHKFRHSVRLRHIKSNRSHANNSAFPTGDAESTRDPTLKGKQQNIPTCVSGIKEWYSQCLYLRSDHPNKPANWKPDPPIKKQVEEKLKDPKVKGNVDRALKRAREQEAGEGDKNNDKEASRPSSGKADDGIFTVFAGAFSTNCVLRSSWILGNGSGIHVCNDTMAHRFVNKRDCTDGSTLIAGNSV